MVDILQLVLSLASFIFLQFSPPQLSETHGNKSVAVVGAGTAGLAMLRALIELDDSNLDIVLYEQRADIGGIWLPDIQPVYPPDLPETPLYPLLGTNRPIPLMTFPGIPHPPETPLFPSHKYVEKYLRDFTSRYNLTPYISFNHEVLSAAWVGSIEQGYWSVIVTDHNGNEKHESFDHLIVASGRNHYPHVITLPGQDAWLHQDKGTNGTGRREILHSIYYRKPQRYANQTVVVVGSGTSARDVATQVAMYAHKVYHSVRSHDYPATGPVEVKPGVTHLTSDAVVFDDGSSAYDVDSIVLATGYDLRIPFLETTGVVLANPDAEHRDEHALTTNNRYLFPLHQHVFSLSSSYPTNALAFVGFVTPLPSCPTDVAQSMYVANVIANASLLASRETLLKELDAFEDDLRSQGYDPYYTGHRLVEDSGFEYQEGLIDRLKAHGAVPDDGRKYVDAWRREVVGYDNLRRAWTRVVELGQQDEWLSGVETEAEWVDLMRRLNVWQDEWETSEGLVFPKETISGDLR